MEINLRKEESVELIIDSACEFIVWGERNEEGTMVIKYEKSKGWYKEPRCKSCGQSKDIHPWACPKFVPVGEGVA
jgi:hypothetical protein